LVWRLLAAAAVAAAIQALSVGYVILLALKIERSFEFVLYTDSQYASGDGTGVGPIASDNNNNNNIVHFYRASLCQSHRGARNSQP
jgi:hypothetical protein